MLELKALLLTQGMHGMVSQTEGLAKALKLNFKHQKIKLKPLWNLIPPKLTPISENLLTEKFVCDSRIVISCGRKSVIPSIALKKRFGNQIFNIHIQDPKVSFNNFDYVIIPEHDGLNGENVITTKGAIHYLRNEELDLYMNYLKPRINKEKIVTLIVGGPTKYYTYNEKVIDVIFSKMKRNFISKGFQLIFIPSMRTPLKIINSAKTFFDKDQIIITEVDKKAYLSSLKLSDYIVVMCDSTSMISECASTGKPIYIFHLPFKRISKRIVNFHEEFENLNITKKFNGNLDTWEYKKLDEAKRIAGILERRI